MIAHVADFRYVVHRHLNSVTVDRANLAAAGPRVYEERLLNFCANHPQLASS